MKYDTITQKSLPGGIQTAGSGSKRAGQVADSRIRVRKKWEIIFSESEDVLDRLADEAIKAHKRGKTKPLDTDRL